MAWAQTQPNGQFRACWRTEQGKQQSVANFRTKALAERFAGEQEAKSRRGEIVRAGRAPKWDEWRDRWLAGRTVSAGTKRQDEIRIARHLNPKWAGIRLNKITRGDVQDWVNELAVTPKAAKKDAPPVPLSPATVDRILRLFSASMKAALLDERVPLNANPCVGVKLPTAAPGHERYLTRGEFDRTIEFARYPYTVAFWLLAYTGMRFGEMAGLHWQRVDLANNLIHIVETWDPVTSTIKPYPKGKEPRAVPIPDRLRPILEAQLDRLGDQTSCGLTHSGGVKCRSGLVVSAPQGGALDVHRVGQREWARVVGLAGIGHVRLHDLRHTYASWLVQNGVAIQEVQRLLGHKTITTTQRYAHLGASQNERVLLALV